MLNAMQILTISQARDSLTKHGETELAGQLGALLDDQAAQRAKHAKRAGRPSAGPQKHAYTVVVEPGGQWVVRGMAEAHARLEQEIRALAKGTRIPTARSMASMISSAGAWWRMVEHANGTTTVTLRKATDAEIAELGT